MVRQLLTHLVRQSRDLVIVQPFRERQVLVVGTALYVLMLLIDVAGIAGGNLHLFDHDGREGLAQLQGACFT